MNPLCECGNELTITDAEFANDGEWYLIIEPCQNCLKLEADDMKKLFEELFSCKLYAIHDYPFYTRSALTAPAGC